MGAKPDPTSKNLYEVLGVSEDATADNIRKTFRKLAREYHPDKRKKKDDDEAFKAIKEAHEVLTDEKRRGLYDKTGFKSEEEMMAETPGPWGPNYHQGPGQQSSAGWGPHMPGGLFGDQAGPGPAGPWGIPPGAPWDASWACPQNSFGEKLHEFLYTDLSQFVGMGGQNEPDSSSDSVQDEDAHPTEQQTMPEGNKIPHEAHHRRIPPEAHHRGPPPHFEGRFFGSEPQHHKGHDAYAGFQSDGRFNPEQDPQSTIQNPMDRMQGLFREYDQTMAEGMVPPMMHHHGFRPHHGLHGSHPHSHAIHTHGHGRNSWRF